MQVELHTFGLMLPLFMSKAGLRFVSNRGSLLRGKLCGSIAETTLFSGMAVTLRTAVINVVCSAYIDIGPRHGSANRPDMFVASKEFVMHWDTQFQKVCILSGMVFEGSRNSAPYIKVINSMPLANLRARYADSPLPSNNNL